jgi:LacI family transcriptional regulator
MEIMRKKPPTMNDVAKIAGVSQATVSYVLNNTCEISEPVKKRVLEAADQLGYIRNGVARSLKTKKANTIGIIVPDVTNTFYSEMTKHTEHIIREQGYFSFICNTSRDPDIEDWYITSLIEQKVAGVIVCYGLVNQKAINKFIVYNIPFVVLDAEPREISREVPCVLVNNIKGSYLAVQHFVSLGISKIAFCSEMIYNNTLKDRYDGFIKAMEQFGIKDQMQHICIDGNIDQQDKIALGYSAAEEIMARSNPEGIFAASDEMAIGTMKFLLEHRYKIPQDVAVIGYDNVPMSALIAPSLTTINQPVLTMSIQGTGMLFNLIAGKEHVSRRIVLEPSIIIRESAPG